MPPAEPRFILMVTDAAPVTGAVKWFIIGPLGSWIRRKAVRAAGPALPKRATSKASGRGMVSVTTWRSASATKVPL